MSLGKLFKNIAPVLIGATLGPGLAGAGMAGALSVPALKSLLPPPITRCNKDDAHDTLTFKAESGKWYENKGNEDGEINQINEF